MSGGEVAEEGPEETPDEPQEMSERTAKVVLVVVACGAMWGIVTAFPWIAYIAVGSGLTLGWQCVRSWQERRREDAEDAELEEKPDVVEALQDLGRKGDSVLLTQLRKRLRVADTKAVKALLKEEGIRFRAGVRTPAGNGPGVHQADIPAPPPPEETPSESGCSCTSEPTTPTPTTDPDPAQGGLRVVPIGDSGYIVHDPAEAVRHHRVK